MLNVADNQSARMSRQQQLHDPEARLRSHRREHVGIFGHMLRVLPVWRQRHISILAELWILVKVIPFAMPRKDNAFAHELLFRALADPARLRAAGRN